MNPLADVTAGYTLPGLGLVIVLAYFLIVSAILRIPRGRHVSVLKYEPPVGASPGVAAWLYGRGRLPRAMAAALVNMAAKGYLKVEQFDESFMVSQLDSASLAPLEPEEWALANAIFDRDRVCDFSRATPQLAGADEAFRSALLATEYLSPNVGLSIPAWAISGLAVFYALIRADVPFHGSSRGLGRVVALTFGCFIVAVRTLPNSLEKMSSRLPGSTSPRRPWTHADTMPFLFLGGAFLGVGFLGLLFTFWVAIIMAAFMVVNAAFYFALQGPTASGRRLLAQIQDYRSFFSEVDADPTSRLHRADRVPTELYSKDAYAVAFHLDLGWGEQFATSVADVIERAEVFVGVPRDSSISLGKIT
jgi:hypothetical protein